MNLIHYLRARLCERSTWSDMLAGLGVVALLPWPWSAFGFGACLLKSLVPDGKVAGGVK